MHQFCWNWVWEMRKWDRSITSYRYTRRRSTISCSPYSALLKLGYTPKTSCKEKRGRKLFLDFYAHYLGPNKVNHLFASLTHTLQNVDYHGEKKKCTFKKYQATHLDQHNISVGLEGKGYSVIDDHAKVRYLIDGIKNNKIEVIKTQVIASPALRKYCTGVCSLFSEYIKQCEGMNHPVCNISEVFLKVDAEVGESVEEAVVFEEAK